MIEFEAVNAREILREKAGMCVVHNKFISCYIAATSTLVPLTSHTKITHIIKFAIYCTITKSRSVNE